MTTSELIFRLLLAAAAGMLLGLERQRGGHPAGARTHLLVAVGACLFTIGGAYGFADVERTGPSDPARIAAQVASGIGFIGAGAILRDGRSTRGITTAATLWISGALGVCVGAGLLWPTLTAVLVVIGSLVTLSGINNLRKRRARQDVEISLSYDGERVPDGIWSTLTSLTGRLSYIHHERSSHSRDSWHLTVTKEQVSDDERFWHSIDRLNTFVGVRDVEARIID